LPESLDAVGFGAGTSNGNFAGETSADQGIDAPVGTKEHLERLVLSANHICLKGLFCKFSNEVP